MPGLVVKLSFLKTHRDLSPRGAQACHNLLRNDHPLWIDNRGAFLPRQDPHHEHTNLRLCSELCYGFLCKRSVWGDDFINETEG